MMSRAVDKSYRLLGARFLRKHAKRLASQLDTAASAEDVEGVHQARVASRRLRAALNMFADCFCSPSIKRWRKEIKRVTTGLGPARDHDVQIIFLAEHLAELTDGKHTRGIATLLGRLERDRARCQPQVVKVVLRLQRSNILDEIIDTTKAIRSRAKAKGIGVCSPLTIERAEQCLSERLSELHREASGLADPTAIEQHHAMRIATKRLRYSLEMLTPVFAGELDDSIVAAKQLQTLLGDIHDYDVWDVRINFFEDKMRRRAVNHYGSDKPFAPIEIGLEHLREICRERRRESFGQLCCYWDSQPLRGIERPCSATLPHTSDSSVRCKNGRPVCHAAR